MRDGRSFFVLIICSWSDLHFLGLGPLWSSPGERSCSDCCWACTGWLLNCLRWFSRFLSSFHSPPPIFNHSGFLEESYPLVDAGYIVIQTTVSPRSSLGYLGGCLAFLLVPLGGGFSECSSSYYLRTSCCLFVWFFGGRNHVLQLLSLEFLINSVWWEWEILLGVCMG